MTTKSLEKLIWVLIYGGLFVLSLGYFLQPQSAWPGWLLIFGGGIAAAAGFVLIWVRSRMKR
jgi:formate hydrogenlyase subunit 3/multisubunit Na+/H+ antiporter MnhD subunit